MMVLVGTETSFIQDGNISDVNCPKCESKNALRFRVYSKYVHITMIPLFAVGKIFESDCSNCNESFDFDDFSENDRQKIMSQKEIKVAETPIWTYSGIAIVIGFIIFGINSYIDNNDLTKERIKTPTVGDIYNLKLDNGYYSTMRIDSTNSNSVYTTENDYQTNLPFDYDDLDKPENYTDSKLVYSKKELLKLYEEDFISSIKRNE